MGRSTFGDSKFCVVGGRRRKVPVGERASPRFWAQKFNEQMSAAVSGARIAPMLKADNDSHGVKLQPGDRIPRLRPNEIIRVVSADAALSTLEQEASLDLWGRTGSPARSDPPFSESARQSCEQPIRRQPFREPLHLLHGDPAHPPRPALEVCLGREVHESRPRRSAPLGLSVVIAVLKGFVRRWKRS